MKNEFLECGIIRTPHGIRGLMNVEVWCDSPKVIASAKKVYIKNRQGELLPLEISSATPAGERVILGLSGISSREEAQGYKNVTLYMKREDIPLPEGSMFIADMLGLPVKDVDTGEIYGEIADVSDGVRYRIYTVKTPKGQVLIPGVDEFVKEISYEGGMLLRPIPGFFD